MKALANDAKYLILDEPTAVLTPQETDQLIAVMRSLRDEGKAIVFITHKLREVREIADKITVIRHGKVVGTAKQTDSEADLAELMVGRAVKLVVDKKPASPTAEPRLVMKASQSPARTARWLCRILILRCSAGRLSASPASKATARQSSPRRCSA